MVKKPKKKPKKKLQRQTAPPKKLEQVLGKRLMLSGLYVLLISPTLIISAQLIQLGVGIDQAFLLVSVLIITIVFTLIVYFQKIYTNYSHPIWVFSLGLVVTFAGFTLSGSLQEMVKKSQEKAKIQHRIFILFRESEAQKSGLERTIADFQTVLFENNDENEKKKFYVRKQLSVYNESDIKNSTSFDFELVTEHIELSQHSHTPDMSSVSEIYNNLTFKSNDPEEMLQSYLELIALHYQVAERTSILASQYRYLVEDESSAEISKQLKRAQKINKDIALKRINDLEELTSKKYPKVTLKVDKNRLLE